jgi:Uma2 family endonuclease
MSVATIAASLPNEGRSANADESLYEIIDGERVELPPMSILAARIANTLFGRLWYFVMSQQLGEAVIETLLHLPLPIDRSRRPDIAYISAGRLAQAPVQPGSDNAWRVAPDLYVEVVSPTDLAEELLAKLIEYFQGGARCVWIIYPTHRLVYAYNSLTDVRVLRDTEELDGGAVVPGFRVLISSLFPQ